MKQVRFLLAALLLMVCGIMAHAQKVVVYKHDGTKVEYASSEVKDVKYQKVYYYYAGWTCPTSVEELAIAITEQYPVSSTNNTMHYAGGIADMTKTYTKESPLKYYDAAENLYYSTAKTNFYLVLPNGIGVYGSDGANSLLDGFTLINTFDNHNVYKSNNTTRNIAGLMLY